MWSSRLPPSMMLPADPKHILIIKLSSLGDVIHALPVTAALRKRFPGSRISWLVNRGFHEILEGNPDIDELILFERGRWGRVSRLASTVSELRNLVQVLKAGSFDLVIDLQGLLRSGLLSYFTDAPVRMGFANAREFSPFFYTHKINVPEEDIHAVDRYLLAAQMLGADVEEVRFPVHLTSADEEWAEVQCKGGTGSPLILVNPSARWVTKQWPLERFAEVCKRLAGEDVRLIMTGGGSDMERCRSLNDMAGNVMTDLSGRTTLKQLAALMKRADLLLTNDSGPMHLAVAVDLPVVALFGPTNPLRTGPYRMLDRVLRKDISCAPCYRRRCANVVCMESIAVDEVVSAIKEEIRRGKNAPVKSG